MAKFADLHIHTNYSDSSASPEEVVREAVDFGLSCIAITDHDTVEGVAPAMKAAQDFNLEIISGIELSTEIQGKDIHLLGYFINKENKALQKVIHDAQNERVQRISIMIEKLKEMGIGPIDLEEVCSLAQSKSVGRPHLAVVLQNKGYVSSFKDAFNKYLGEHCPAYVKKYKLAPFDAINLIKGAGGAAVLAHPMVNNRDELIPQLVDDGLQGIEVFYPNCSETVKTYYQGIAKKHNLVMTGGSDAHGKEKVNTYIGKSTIPYEYVEMLKSRTNNNS